MGDGVGGGPMGCPLGVKWWGKGGGGGSWGGVPPRVVPRQGACKARSEHMKERIHSERASGSAGKLLLLKAHAENLVRSWVKWTIFWVTSWQVTQAVYKRVECYGINAPPTYIEETCANERFRHFLNGFET